MTERAAHFLTGGVGFTVSGSPAQAARFFTLCARQGFALWDFSPNGARCRPSLYPKLRPTARRCGVRLRCRERRGLPFLLLPLRRRKGIPLGAVLGACLYAWLSLFVWEISAQGGEALTERAILRAAAEQGVSLGAKRDAFVPRVAVHGLMAALPELSWAAVNTDGCAVTVLVREAEPKPEAVDDREWSNLYAARAGVVLSVEAERGRPQVAPGDTVEQGQLLVAGVYAEQPQPYRFEPILLQVRGPARGRVWAETYRPYQVRVSAAREELVTVRRERRYALRLFGLRLPLGLFAAPAGPSRVSQTLKPLTALDKELPLAVECTTVEHLEPALRVLSREEQQRLALLLLRERQKAELAPEAAVLRESLHFSFDGEGCTLTADCRCREQIAVLEKILVN